MVTRDVRAARLPSTVIVSSHGMSEIVRSVTQIDPTPSSAASTAGQSRRSSRTRTGRGGQPGDGQHRHADAVEVGQATRDQRADGEAAVPPEAVHPDGAGRQAGWATSPTAASSVG